MASATQSVRTIRRRLRQELPADTFEPRPGRGILGFAQIGAYALILAWLAQHLSAPLAVKLLASFVLGQLIVAYGFIAHEVLHGAVFRSRFWQRLYGAVAFSPFFITPGLWTAWHVQVHHGNANVPSKDPDTFGWKADLPERPRERAFMQFMPATGPWFAWLSLPFLFTLQAQVVLWHFSGKEAFRNIGFNRRTAQAGSVALMIGQVALGVWLGWEAALFGLILPHLVADMTLMAYISTNHWLDPIDHNVNNPLRNTTSVATPRIVDWIHGWFSYHQEHHIFPAMSPVHAPRLRAKLREIAPEAVSVVPHLRALKGVLSSPRTYALEYLLESPDGSKQFDLREFRQH